MITTPPYSYEAVCETNPATQKRRTMFFAPAVDISIWSGIPQKMIIEGESGTETIGFQRVENPTRVSDIKTFYLDPQNTSPNPILCAVKSPESGTVSFSPLKQTDGNNKLGLLNITLENFKEKSLAELFKMLRESLDERIEDLEQAKPTEQEIDNFKRSLVKDSVENEDNELNLSEEAIVDLETNNVDQNEIPTIESHIVAFRKAIALREVLCAESTTAESDEFAGFTKDRLISFLLPVVLVDGQHRLRGALEAARAALLTPEAQEKQAEIYNSLSEIYSGKELEDKLEEEKLKLLRSASPMIPISLLLDADPAEQVFQFVVVNQKSVPVGKALLGTIVSTTLSESELDKVRGRLNNAGIQLENSRAITKLVVSPTSPFYNKVDRGLQKEVSELLQWNVLLGLIQIVRNLKGARLYHEERGSDYANFWKETLLDRSKITDDYADYGHDDRYKYWSSENGPWEVVFKNFFSAVKEKLANSTSEESHNYWGRPISSNIFNKVYLNILLADFFHFLYSKDQPIDSAEQIYELVDNWLAGVSTDYFSKPWQLSDKKDSTTIKKKWSQLWHNYRITPTSMKRVPQGRQFG